MHAAPCNMCALCADARVPLALPHTGRAYLPHAWWRVYVHCGGRFCILTTTPGAAARRYTCAQRAPRLPILYALWLALCRITPFPAFLTYRSRWLPKGWHCADGVAVARMNTFCFVTRARAYTFYPIAGAGVLWRALCVALLCGIFTRMAQPARIIGSGFLDQRVWSRMDDGWIGSDLDRLLFSHSRHSAFCYLLPALLGDFCRFQPPLLVRVLPHAPTRACHAATTHGVRRWRFWFAYAQHCNALPPLPALPLSTVCIWLTFVAAVLSPHTHTHRTTPTTSTRLFVAFCGSFVQQLPGLFQYSPKPFAY